MAKNKIDSGEITNMTNVVTTYQSPFATSTTETSYQAQWDRWYGIYKDIFFLASLVNAKSFWTVGKGFKASKDVKKMLGKINGNGKQTFNTILYNMVKTYTIGGDSFAEIIKHNGKIINLKPLNPGSIKIIANNKGRITKYEQFVNSKIITTWKPKDMFHLPWDATADEIHGNGSIEKVETTAQAYKEAKNDMRIVFHRYVKPLIISHVDTDNEEEIAAYKNKLDRAIDLGENMVIPYDTLKSMDKMSIPQFSTLDPLPWIASLERDFIVAENCPSVIVASTEKGDVEASVKVLYLAWQQVIEWNQMFVEEQILAQLGIKIKLEFPASLEPALQGDNAKARKMNNQESGIGSSSGGTK